MLKVCTLTLLIIGQHLKSETNVIKGGTLRTNLTTVPTTLNPFSATDAYSDEVHAYVFDTLLYKDPETQEFKLSLAKSYQVDKNGKYIDFTLRDNAIFSDGKPVTCADIQFTFNAIMDPKDRYKTAAKKSFFENFDRVDILKPYECRFVIKKAYYKNLDVAGGLGIIPKHIYENKFNDKNLNKTVVGSGPYILSEFDRSKQIVLKKNPKWWGNNLKEFSDIYNFDKIQMRFVAEENVSFTAFEKGEFDIIDGGSGFTIEAFMKKTNGPKWGKSVFKEQVENSAPKGYGFIAFNLKNPKFTKKTRLALTHLYNREMVTKKFFYGMSVPAIGPVHFKSDYADPNVKALEFDPKKSAALLKEDGWKLESGDQLLSKTIDGKKELMTFTILLPSQDFIKYLTSYQEDAKKIGVGIEIKTIDWNAFIKLIDERKFETAGLGWGASSTDWEPKQIWHSESIANQGSNFISYNNSEVDQLIDEARMEMNRDKRIKTLRKVFRLIAEDAPYIFLFNSKYTLYAYSDKVKRPKPTMKYTLGVNYWSTLK